MFIGAVSISFYILRVLVIRVRFRCARRFVAPLIKLTREDKEEFIKVLLPNYQESEPLNSEDKSSNLSILMYIDINNKLTSYYYLIANTSLMF